MKKFNFAEMSEPSPDLEPKPEPMMEEKCPTCGQPAKAEKAPKSISDLKAIRTAISAKRPMRK